MKTIGNIIHQDKFSLYILDDNRDVIYYENSIGYWVKRKFNSKGQIIYSESLMGVMVDRTNENNWKHNP